MRWALGMDVVVAAMRSPSGASAALVLAAIGLRLTWLANAAMVLECEAVCLREVHGAAAGLALADAIFSFNHRGFGAAPARFGIRLLLPRDALRSPKP